MEPSWKAINDDDDEVRIIEEISIIFPPVLDDEKNFSYSEIPSGWVCKIDACNVSVYWAKGD